LQTYYHIQKFNNQNNFVHPPAPSTFSAAGMFDN